MPWLGAHSSQADCPSPRVAPPTTPPPPKPALALPRRRLLQGATGVGLAQLVAGGLTGSAGAVADAVGAQLEARVAEFTLPNGLHFLVLERRNAPVVSCHTLANVGAFDEAPGQTGVAHLLEHMAFKGGPRVGGRDARREAALLAACDEAFYELRELRQRSSAEGGAASTPAAVAARLLTAEEALQRRMKAAGELSDSNAFGAALQGAGAVGLNATTSHDCTRYFTSLPANKLELWFALEAERFRAPVFRELYTEKRVVAEERRVRVDNSPLGRFQEAFALRALSSNYGRPVVGFADDIEALGTREVRAFFDAHYGPRNLTVAVVGATTPDEVHAFAEKYFGSWQPSPSLVPAHPALAAEPLPGPRGDALGEGVPAPEGIEQTGSRRIETSAAAGPLLLKAFYRPNAASDDAIALDVMSDVLSGGRTSRFARALQQRGLAFSANAIPAFPSDKHACTVLLSAIPSFRTPLGDLEGLLMGLVEELGRGGPSPDEIQGVTRGARKGLLEALTRNSSMAGLLATSHAVQGSWRSLLDDLQRLEALSPADVARVTRETFQEGNAFTGVVRGVPA